MPHRHDLATIAAMAVLASAGATLLHEGLGHGVTAWALGAHPTMLTSNHLSAEGSSPWISAGGTLVNLAVGTMALAAAQGSGAHANRRYFLWLFGALNLLPGAGYFLFSGIGGVGDWYAIIEGWPREGAWRIGMAAFGAALYFAVVRLLATTVRPFVPERPAYNAVGRWPYLVAGGFSVVAGLLDPLGLPLLFLSTVPAAFGGSSGLLWADNLIRWGTPSADLAVRRQVGWWLAALVLGGAYVAILGPGLPLG